MFEDVRGQPLDPLWVAEFCGFFMGEGTLGIYKASRPGRLRGGEAYFGTATISQRADGIAVLEDIQSKLGGTVVMVDGVNFTNPQAYNYLRKPQVNWRSQRVSTLQTIVAMLQTTRMPHPKLRVLSIMVEFLAIPRVRGQHIDPTVLEHMRRLYALAKESHLYLATTT